MRKHLGISRGSLLKWIANKGTPTQTIGNKWKFKLSEIDVCVNSRE